MALDEMNHRLFIATRTPPTFFAFDTDTGKIVATVPISGFNDDLWFDFTRKRIYLSGSETTTVLAQTGANTYVHVADVPTGYRAKTSLYVPQMSRFYVAVSGKGKAGRATGTESVRRATLSAAGIPRYPPACQPPSTNRVWPVTKSEAGLARNRAAPTRSEGSANRPSTMRLRNRSARASFSRMIWLVFSVSVVVGAMALTRTPERRPFGGERRGHVGNARPWPGHKCSCP